MKADDLVTFAYAKINLGLSVKGKRPDGYHELQTVMQTIELHDTVKISRVGNDEIECLCGGLSGPRNLAYQAARLFREGINSHQGIRLEIEKKIPIQAGLAGGSADAAATLRGLNQLYNQPYSQEEILQLANQLGSDIAFCLNGGTQWAEGRGEKLLPLTDVPEMFLIIVKPQQGINTGESYRKFDQLGKSHPLSFHAWDEALQSGSVEKIASLLSNDLEAGSQIILPLIERLKEGLKENGCYGALMSGSGSAVFGIAHSAEHAQEIAHSLQKRGYLSWATKTITP
ncbi:4-(cytidine 5'-diphospho)-2-C-methyl-D-erythritol kinase [Desulfitobacterium metallireducens]|uniref:4-diphosphocytidyl-2-C-methyl-D-erythritol kinase n=1 Tax=Desulfitobacterium metallireducens DSM 15288 TaxID=871968 RepID=W0E9J1_9FIRM|nr:4-(cytidine 5'-diphospho)-2-C-methyl-D-erythritol kinase [Desulfitobacterium metallireducens]AHF05711.1 4-diphosphocytidyl-2C-methyl-D-erythritol kinase [Desulfitobacterium metallireducens DSM 15288]